MHDLRWIINKFFFLFSTNNSIQPKDEQMIPFKRFKLCETFQFTIFLQRSWFCQWIPAISLCWHFLFHLVAVSSSHNYSSNNLLTIEAFLLKNFLHHSRRCEKREKQLSEKLFSIHCRSNIIIMLLHYHSFQVI